MRVSVKCIVLAIFLSLFLYAISNLTQLQKNPFSGFGKSFIFTIHFFISNLSLYTHQPLDLFPAHFRRSPILLSLLHLFDLFSAFIFLTLSFKFSVCCFVEVEFRNWLLIYLQCYMLLQFFD